MKFLLIVTTIFFMYGSAFGQHRQTERCRSFYNNENYDRCISIAERQLSDDRSLGELYYLKGLSHFRLYEQNNSTSELNNALREISNGMSRAPEFIKSYQSALTELQRACRKFADELHNSGRESISGRYYRYLASMYQDTTEQYMDLFVYSERPDGEIIKQMKAGELNQTDEQGRKQGLWRKVYPTGVTAYEVRFKDDKPQGTMLRYHPNSRLMAEMEFNNDGTYAFAKLYDEQENLIAKGYYKGQKKDSVWQYFRNDILVLTETYQDGELTGPLKAYYPNGKVYDRRMMENGVENGTWFRYHSDESIMLKATVENDMIQGEFVRYQRNGTIEEKGQYLDDLRTGNWEFYSEDGEKTVITYQKGIPENIDELEMEQAVKYQEQINNRLKDPENFKNNPYEYINE